MSADLEDRIIRALHAEAATAPAAGHLLNAVHARARQRRHRRVGLAGAMAVVVVAGASALATTLPGGNGDVLRPQPPFAGASPGPLASGSPQPLQFPLTPGWLPDGLARPPHVSLGQSGLEASYRDASKADLLGIDLWSSDHDVTLKGDGVTRRPTTVEGHAGVLATAEGAVSLGWQPTTGRWLAVTASNRWADESIARRVAAALEEQPLDVTSPFSMDVVPRDSELAEWNTDGRFVFTPRGQGQQWRDRGSVPDALQIAVRRATADLTGRGDRVTVQRRPGWLLQDDGGWTLVVQLTDQVCLVLHTPMWDRADVLRLADATHYTGGLPPAEG